MTLVNRKTNRSLRARERIRPNVLDIRGLSSGVGGGLGGLSRAGGFGDLPGFDVRTGLGGQPQTFSQRFAPAPPLGVSSQLLQLQTLMQNIQDAMQAGFPKTNQKSIQKSR